MGSIDTLNFNIKSAKITKNKLENIISWPHATSGFLDPTKIEPTLTENTANNNLVYGNYEYKDWRGQMLKTPENKIKTEDRFRLSKEIPKKDSELIDNPYSMRDVPLIFGDNRYDYFRYGLQVIDGINPIDNLGTDTRLASFKETPWEQNDPVMYGFDIVFDTLSSPLLNGSLLDFINNYSNVSEISSKKNVYESFKHQFSKFFRTTTPLKIAPESISFTKTNINPALIDTPSGIYTPGKTNYFGYYLKKIGGLDFLIEQNKGDTVKYLPDYKKDMITLDFLEDVSLSVGTLAHLYKILYWSKPNGKMLIPENLLRFNCYIIISECRNFQRVKKSGNNINVLKDNLSRWIYSIKECQFYFDKMPLPNDVDLGSQGPQIFENYQVNFDFKYSTVKLERFIPDGDWGKYVGYDGGSTWKIGNAGARNSENLTDLSTPTFYTEGLEKTYAYYPNTRENGVEKPFIISIYGKDSQNNSTQQTTAEQTNTTSETSINDIAKNSEQVSAQIQEQQTNQSIIDSNSSTKKVQFGSLKKNILDDALSKIKKPAGTPLSSIVANNSVKDKIPNNFFDKMGTLKIKEGFNFNASDLTNSLQKANFGVPSLDQIKSSFSTAKEGASSGFFDIRGNLKSSLTEGFNFNVSDLTNSLQKANFGVPSLDQIKSSFSTAKEGASSGFFDIRGNLKSSLTEGLTNFNEKVDSVNSLMGQAKNKSNKTSSLVTKLLNDELNKSMNISPSLNTESLINKFSNAKEISVGQFFDIRSQISGETGKDVKSQNLRANLLNETINKIYGPTKPVTSPLNSETPPPTSFFDLKNQLKDFLGGPLGSKLTE